MELTSYLAALQLAMSFSGDHISNRNTLAPKNIEENTAPCIAYVPQNPLRNHSPDCSQPSTFERCQCDHIDGCVSHQHIFTHTHMLVTTPHFCVCQIKFLVIMK